MPGKYAPLILSRGEQYQFSLTPRTHGAKTWPVDSTVLTTVYDTAGGTIAVLAGTVTPEVIMFDVDPSEVDIIPAGAHFETFLTTTDGKKFQIRYGQVIRKEARFNNAPATDTTATALQFRDNFYARTGLVGSKWVPVVGKPTIFDNSGAGLPNGCGPANIFFDGAAMRFYAPLNSDSWILSFTLLNPGPGTLCVVGSSNAAMSSFLYAMFVTDPVLSGNRKIHMGRGTGPIARVDMVTPVAHTVANNTNYKLRYDDLTKKLVLLNSDMMTELISWTDTDHIVPHGLGYRYFGATFQGTLLSSGPQLTQMSAQDGLEVAA